MIDSLLVRSIRIGTTH